MWDFLKKKRLTAGVDMGGTALKLVSLTFESARPILNEVLCLEDRDRGIRHDRIQVLASQSSNRYSKIAVVMPPNMVDIQYFTLPPLPVDDLRNTVRLQMAGKLDYAIEDACIDYTVSATVSRGNKTMNRVIGFACRRTDAHAVVDRFAKAGLNVTCLDAVPMTLLNAYRFSLPSCLEETVIGIDLGQGTANVIVAEKGVLLFYRYFPFKRSSGGVDETLHGETIDEIVYEIKRTIEYCQNHILPVQISRIVLSGGRALSVGLLETIQQTITVPCEVLDCLPDTLLNPGRRERKQLEAVAKSRFAIATGLALRIGEQE